MESISLRDYEAFSDLITLGSFSPTTFHISLDTKSTESFSDIPHKTKSTLGHEFGHLLHYLTSYLGLKDLSYWIDIINVLETPWSGTNQEESITNQATKILKIAREKQKLSIDDEYYFESRSELFDYARKNKNQWHIKSVTGAFFKVDGKISHTDRFWATRFFVGSPDVGESFMRIPIGMRTLLEHMANAIDFVSDISVLNEDEFTHMLESEAYEPDLLHYYCLSHWAGPMLERKYGKSGIGKAFLVSGQLVHLIVDIPFDDPVIWQSIISYAKKCKSDLVPYLEKPHPSFVYPLLLHAAEHSSQDFNTFDITDVESCMESLLYDMGLPTLPELRAHTYAYSTELCSRVNESSVGKSIKELIEWMNSYSESISWRDRVVAPLRALTEALPVPLLFNDRKYWDGSIIKMSDVMYLERLFNRQQEMLRYPYMRNLIE